MQFFQIFKYYNITLLIWPPMQNKFSKNKSDSTRIDYLTKLYGLIHWLRIFKSIWMWIMSNWGDSVEFANGSKIIFWVWMSRAFHMQKNLQMQVRRYHPYNIVPWTRMRGRINSTIFTITRKELELQNYSLSLNWNLREPTKWQSS